VGGGTSYHRGACLASPKLFQAIAFAGCPPLLWDVIGLWRTINPRGSGGKGGDSCVPFTGLWLCAWKEIKYELGKNDGGGGRQTREAHHTGKPGTRVVIPGTVGGMSQG
jgi:hypothetical protein